MIKIYVSPSCSSCRKVKKWFKDQNIPFEEKNIFTDELKPEELRNILMKTDNGTEDIISNKSKIIKEGNVDVESMTVSEMIEFIRKNPSVLRRPIMVDDEHDRLQVGYNADDISIFIPRARRELTMPCFLDDCCDDDNKK